MTTDLRTALAEAVDLRAKATPGPWHTEAEGTRPRLYGLDPDRWYEDSASIAAAANLLADHGPALLAALDRAERVEAAARDIVTIFARGGGPIYHDDLEADALRTALATTDPPDDFPPEEPTTIEGALGALELAVGMLRLRPHICGVIWPGGPNGEPLACAYPPNPPGKPMHEHSWSWVPTATDPEPSDTLTPDPVTGPDPECQMCGRQRRRCSSRRTHRGCATGVCEAFTDPEPSGEPE